MTRKAALCRNILVEAERLVGRGHLSAPLSELLFRACEILDDIDDVLVGLHPRRDCDSFAVAEALHRQLEQLQETIPHHARGVLSSRSASRDI